MATTFNFNLNRRQAREKIASRCGIRAAGNVLKPEDRAVINTAIDLRLKELHRKQALWFSTSGDATALTLTAGVATVEATSPGFLFPISFMLDVDGKERPIEIIDHRTFQSIEDKAEAGEPKQAFFDGTTAYLWPVPITTRTAWLTFQGMAADSNDVDPLDMDVGAMRVFLNLVALDVADDFDVDEAKVQRWMASQAGWMRELYALSAERTDTPHRPAEYF